MSTAVFTVTDGYLVAQCPNQPMVSFRLITSSSPLASTNASCMQAWALRRVFFSQVKNACSIGEEFKMNKNLRW